MPWSALLSWGALATTARKATGVQFGLLLIIHGERGSPVGNAVLGGLFLHIVDRKLLKF